MKKTHTGLFEVKLDEQTRFEDKEAKALSQREVFKPNRVKSSELKASKTATVAKGSTERQSERVIHKALGIRSATIKKTQHQNAKKPPKHNYKAMEHCLGLLPFPQHWAVHQNRE